MPSIKFARLALVAGAAFTVAGCGSRPAATNTAGNAAALGNDLGAPMNDASAMETVSNAGIAPTPSNTTNSAGSETIAPPSGNGSVESNVAGM